MFKSNSRPLAIPQSEHARQVAAIAEVWGNEQFDKPNLPLDSFVMGVALHDRGYPELDNAPINEVDESQWLAIQKRGISQSCDDPVADIIVRLQLLRLLRYQLSAEREACADELEAAIEAQIEASDYQRDAFLFADYITCFCDTLSYDFCFETPTSRTLEVQARVGSEQKTEVAYQVQQGGVVSIAPWPLGVEELSGTMSGYELDGYPERLVGVVVGFVVRPG